MDFARCGFGIEFPVRSSGSGSSNGYGHASKTFVNIVNVIGARTVLWMFYGCFSNCSRAGEGTTKCFLELKFECEIV